MRAARASASARPRSTAARPRAPLGGGRPPRRASAALRAALLAALLPLAAPAAAGAVSADLVRNGSFADGADGWGAFQGRVTSVGDDAAPDGDGRAAEVAVAGGSAAYTLDDDPASVPRTVAGRRYAAVAWVRSGTPSSVGRPARLVLRTAAPGADPATCAASRPVALSPAWTRLGVVCVPRRDGEALDLYVDRPAGATAGERFRADALSITTPTLADVPRGNLTRDPSLTAPSGVWGSSQAAVDAVATPDAPDGATAGRVLAGPGALRGPVVVGSAEPPVAETVEGRTYAAEASVRGPVLTTPFGRSRTARLLVRERDADGRTTSTASGPVVLDPDRWQRLRVSASPAGGARLDVRVQYDGLRPGDGAGLDAVTLVAVPLATVYGSATTVRSDRPLPPGGAAGADVTAARNESASFQVALRTAGTALSGVRMALDGPLDGPGGARLPTDAVALSRERDYVVRVPTDGEGEAGRWPDALVPDRDPLLGGDGGAFPLAVTPERPQTVWADVAVPPDARPGRYTGALRITADDAAPVVVPVAVTVRPFALPSSSSLRSLFVLNPYRVCAASDEGGDGGYAQVRRPDGRGCDPGDEETWRLFARFAALGLRDRISIANPYPTPRMVAPSETAAVRAAPARPDAPGTEARAFDLHVRPLLDGTAPLGALPGARLDTITTQWECLQELQAGCTAGWRTFLGRHAPEAAGRFLVWACDEPAFDDAGHFTPWKGNARTKGSCENDRALSRAGWPQAPVKITTPISDPGLYPDRDVRPSTLGRAAVDVLAPNQTELVTRDGGDTRGRYDERPADARRIPPWIYVSCTSGGCDPGAEPGDASIADPAHDGWPSYAIDQPASQASAVGWMAFLYRLGGESYFDVAAGFDDGPDFQHGIRTYGTNGDGLLFYPGTVVVDGRREPMPLESIRLKRIREGREDYEYLHRLERCGRRDEALGIVRRLFGDEDRAMFSTTVGQAALDRARDDLATLIERGRC